MKWFLFILYLFIAWNCKDHPAPAQKDIPSTRDKPPKYNDTARMPSASQLEGDTGYFKGTIPEPVLSLEQFNDTHLEQGLKKLIRQDSIILLDDETLSYAVFVDPVKHTRHDTMRNKHTVLINEIRIDKGRSQKASLNGKAFIDFEWDGTEADEEDYGPVMLFDASTFRHLSFYGRSYYYIQAREAYMYGASAANITYHYLLDEQVRIIGLFQTCRFNKILLGDADGDRRLDFLDFDNSDFCTTVPLSDNVIINLYSDEGEKGLVMQKDVPGKSWQLNARTGDGYAQDSLVIVNVHWPAQLTSGITPRIIH